MIAPHLISDTLPPLHADDTGDEALVKMHEYNVSQLPVVSGKKYIGLLTLEEVVSSKHLSRKIEELIPVLRKPSVSNQAHIFDVMKAALEFNVRVVPVVDDQYNYLGLISAESCLRAFAVLNSVNETGSIIELEIAEKDYQLSEIARIVEDSEAEIYCLYTHLNVDSSVMEVTLKVNVTDVSAMVASFERFNYTVLNVYNETEYTQDLKERYDHLMRYLNV